MNEVHLVPEKEGHELDVDCWCKPEVKLIANGVQIVHNTKKKFVKWEIWTYGKTTREA